MARDKRSGGGAGGTAGRGRAAGGAAAATGASTNEASPREAGPARPELKREVLVAGTAEFVGEDLFGRTLSNNDWADLVGAPDGATVRVATAFGEAMISTTHPDYEGSQSRIVRRTPDGKLEIYNQMFFLKPNTPPGTGTRIFANQVAKARELGVDQIAVTAGGYKGSSMNGYYTWPRLGYDGKIPSDLKDSLPSSLKKSNTLNDLYRTQEGRDWWRENGDQVRLTFDLRPDSISSRTLQAYLEEKGY